MRCSKRRLGYQRASGGQQTGDRVDPRHLESLVAGQRRQDARQPARQHRLTCTGRAGKQEIVSACRRELECAAGAFLPANVREIEWLLGGPPGLGRLARLRLPLAPQVRGGLAQVVQWDRIDPGQRRFGRRSRRAEQP